jgi:SAM-dependent methyltransferase
VECGADKGSSHPVKPHNYAVFYDRVFGHLRQEQIKILEVGCGGGESMRMWLTAFPNAHVYGCDIVAGTNPYNTHYPADKVNPNPRYDFLQGDQGDKTHWACYLAYSGEDFTIVVDDGSHRAKDIQVTFDCLWPTVVPGGWFCIEDLAAGSTVGTVFLSPGYASHMDWLRGLIEKMNLGENDIAEVLCFQELAILKKKQ